MKLKNILFNCAVGLLTISLGLVCFNIWNLFFGEKKKNKLVFETSKKEYRLSNPVVIQKPVITPLPVIETEARPETTPKFETEPEINIDGTYLIKGNLPKELKGFEFFEFWASTYEAENNYEATPVPPEGILQAKESHKFDKIFLGNKQISFTTEKIKGISYEFTGKFKTVKYKEYNDYEMINIEGVLIKKKNGKQTAKAKVTLVVHEGC